MNHSMNQHFYRTDELMLAAYLIANDHTLQGMDQTSDGSAVWLFAIGKTLLADVDDYQSDELLRKYGMECLKTRRNMFEFLDSQKAAS